MDKNQDFLYRFTHVALEGRTYLNLIYLILMLPLGIIYFTIFVTAVSLSLSLLILIIGIFIAFVFVLFVRAISGIHLRFASAMLGFEQPDKKEILDNNKGFIDRLKFFFTDGKTYSSLIYMFIELPLGIIYFTLIITFLSISISFSLSPILWIIEEETGIFINSSHWVWRLDFDETILLMLVGIGLFLVTLHLGNLLAKVEEFLCKNLLLRL